MRPLGRFKAGCGLIGGARGESTLEAVWRRLARDTGTDGDVQQAVTVLPAWRWTGWGSGVAPERQRSGHRSGSEDSPGSLSGLMDWV